LIDGTNDPCQGMYDLLTLCNKGSQRKESYKPANPRK
jgi:hypothetical protein